MSASFGEHSRRTIGRYRIGGLVASGGMATVHLGQVRGAVGFSRTVAIKRMLAHFASDPDFATMFADEARLAARIRHPNVVSTLDVVLQGAELCIVMEYVQGVTLAQLRKLAAERGEPIPAAISVAILRDMLQGLHSAHEAVDTDGRPLGIVHRDVSPQNVIVGVDGVARVLDFGIAKANIRLHQTREGGGLKGKLAYMAPEQLEGAPVVRQSDIFAASVVLWESLTGQRAYAGSNEGEVVAKLLRHTPPRPSEARPELGDVFDSVVMRGLARTAAQRFETARAMAIALTNASDAASAAEVGEWVERTAAGPLAERTARVRELETLLHDEEVDAASADADPEVTHPAIPAGIFEPSSRPLAVPQPLPQPVALQAAPPVASRGARVVAVAVAVACGITAFAVRASHERTGAHSAPIPAAVAVAAAGAIAVAPTSTAEPPMSTAALPSTVPAAVPEPAVTNKKPRRSPPRASSRVAAPSIPDHL